MPKEYKEFITNVQSCLTEREDIEWTNFWRDNARNNEVERILLIGDSNSRIIRSTFSDYLQKPVDLIATSSGLHDELFINQIDCFFSVKEYRYSYIFVQFGHHAEHGRNSEYYTEEDYSEFEQDFRNFLLYLCQYTKKIIVESTFYTVFPYKRTIWNRLIRPKEKYDDITNARKARKNQIMKRVAQSLQLQFCDINQYMLTQGKNFRHFDEIHFEERAKPFIVAKLAENM